MPDPRLAVSSSAILRIPITIPANTGDGESIMDLLDAGGLDSEKDVIGVKILARIPDGTDRGAFHVCDVATDATFDTHGQHVAGGADYYEPAVGDAFSFVRSASGTEVEAIAVVYLD